jgi:hypothetical protein
MSPESSSWTSEIDYSDGGLSQLVPPSRVWPCTRKRCNPHTRRQIDEISYYIASVSNMNNGTMEVCKCKPESS